MYWKQLYIIPLVLGILLLFSVDVSSSEESMYVYEVHISLIDGTNYYFDSYISAENQGQANYKLLVIYRDSFGDLLDEFEWDFIEVVEIE